MNLPRRPLDEADQLAMARASRRQAHAIHALFRALAGETVTYVCPTPEDAQDFAAELKAAARLLNRKEPS